MICAEKGLDDRKAAIRNEQTAALTLMFDICRDTACRAILSSVRTSMRKFVTELTPLTGIFKLVISKQLKPGYRLYFWIGVPFVVETMLRCVLYCLL